MQSSATARSFGIYFSLDELGDVVDLSADSRDFLEDTAAVGAFSILGAESVGPTVGADLQKKAMLAISFSLVGMLIYIWIRFQLPYAVGAVAALFHDVLITLIALAVTHREINLPTVAALLTLVGYSVNDTVVVFDRMRENLRLHRGDDLEQLMNLSINQTLSRTIITSGTTLMVVLSLYIFGGRRHQHLCLRAPDRDHRRYLLVDLHRLPGGAVDEQAADETTGAQATQREALNQIRS